MVETRFSRVVNFFKLFITVKTATKPITVSGSTTVVEPRFDHGIIVGFTAVLQLKKQ